MIVGGKEEARPTAMTCFFSTCTAIILTSISLSILLDSNTPINSVEIKVPGYNDPPIRLV